VVDGVEIWRSELQLRTPHPILGRGQNQARGKSVRKEATRFSTNRQVVSQMRIKKLQRTIKPKTQFLLIFKHETVKLQ